MTTNLPEDFNVANLLKTNGGLVRLNQGLYRFKWIKLSRRSILNDYLCILRGNVARSVCCKSSTGTTMAFAETFGREAVHATCMASKR